MNPVVGRFAPTPSGHLHLGNLLCAMLSWLSVRSRGGKFLLRIEDVDLPRCPEKASLQVIADLETLGFDWDEPPIWQSRRTEAYEAVFQKLKEQNLVYPCFCTRTELHAGLAPNAGDTQFLYPGTCRDLTPEQVLAKSAIRKPAWRVRVPDRIYRFEDRLFGIQQENIAKECGDFIIRRSDGLFGYQLAVVADDAFSGVTEIVRGHDILSSTPRQLFLQESLGYSRPEYIHIPLLQDAKGRRLAKRDADLSLDQLLLRFTREELLGALAFSCGLLDEWEPVTLAGMVVNFSWNRVRKDDIRLPEKLCK